MVMMLVVYCYGDGVEAVYLKFGAVRELWSDEAVVESWVEQQPYAVCFDVPTQQVDVVCCVG